MKKIPGIDFSTGSLGQGMPVGVGMALAGKLDGRNYHVYVMIGDGESQEGSIWEASMAAAHYKLDNLTVILDHNGLQIDGPNDKVMTINPVEDKWKAFGWNVITIDGHNISQIINAFDSANIVPGKPTMIIAKTVKGKGVSFMENEAGWHGKAPKPEELEQALVDLSKGNVSNN
jgi:transketolase